MTTDPYGPPKLDTSVPQVARRYNYWLGGKDNFEVDRESADQIAAMYPSIRTAAIENRRFLRRVTTFLTEACGIRQFLDIGAGLPAPDHIGTGLPPPDSIHEVAQRIAPESRVVYVDNDPMVMVHARALLTSAEFGETAYVEEDLRNPEKILAEARKVLDFREPIALMLLAVLHFIGDADEPGAIVRKLLDALPAGSYLAVSHATYDPIDPETIARLNAIANDAGESFRSRSEKEVAALLDGLDLVEPGLVPVTQWRPEPGSEPVAFADAAVYAAVGPQDLTTLTHSDAGAPPMGGPVDACCPPNDSVGLHSSHWSEMSQSTYALDNDQKGAGTTLSWLAQMLDPGTKAILDDLIPVAGGCLELGAGTGSVAGWMAGIRRQGR